VRSGPAACLLALAWLFPPAATAAGPAPGSGDPQAGAAPYTNLRKVFVVSPRQKSEVVRSLLAAGFDVRRNLLEAGTTLRVTVGGNQGWRDCGTRNNVQYVLKRDASELANLVEKGWTGSCQPSVFDALSQRLMEWVEVLEPQAPEAAAPEEAPQP
jgi:hypothetical protein